MGAMKQEESKSLTRRHFKRLCRVILDKDDSPESGKKVARFGRFLLKSELGRGSFGVVWRAHDPTMDRDVALKILPPTSRDSDQDRFLREVRAAARLKHPGIVSVYEMGEVEGRPFLVMDLIEGETLGLPVKFKKRKLLEIMVQLVETLQYAHGKGLVHRDIKPSNILIGKDGRPVLVDFGLARTIGRDERVTMTGAVFGTPAYMSPEQAGGTPGEVDARSDLYSLGVVLYEMLGGRLPHEGSTPYEITQSILNDDPPRLRSLNPKIPAELEAITFMAMSRSRDQRYASAQEFVEDLRAFLEGKPVRARQVSPLRLFFRRLRRRPWIPASAVGACALISVGIWVGSAMGGSSPGPPPVRPGPDKPPVPGDPTPKPLGSREPLFLPELHQAFRATVDGVPGPDQVKLRSDIEARLAESPKNLILYISLAQLDLLEGKEGEVMGRFDAAEAAGAPLEETLSARIGFSIVMGGPFLFQKEPGKIDFSSLFDVPAFRRARNGLHNLGPSITLKVLENLMLGKSGEEGPLRPRGPEGPGRGKGMNRPDLRLFFALNHFNARRYPDVVSQLSPLRGEYPSPAFGSLLAVAQLAVGRPEEARNTIEEFGRLPMPPGEDFFYVRALVSLEQERWKDCREDLERLPDSVARKYTEALLLIAQGDKRAAGPVLESCGDYYPALFELACLQAKVDPEKAMNTLEEAVSGMPDGKIQNRPGGKPAIGLKNIRPALPWFTIDRGLLDRIPMLRHLRDDPRTRDRFMRLLRP